MQNRVRAPGFWELNKYPEAHAPEISVVTELRLIKATQGYLLSPMLGTALGAATLDRTDLEYFHYARRFLNKPHWVFPLDKSEATPFQLPDTSSRPRASSCVCPSDCSA